MGAMRFLLHPPGRISPDDAQRHYLAMLAVDPAHLHGLWSLIENALDETRPVPVSVEEKQIVATLAAQILVAHPHSAAARFLAEARGDQ